MTNKAYMHVDRWTVVTGNNATQYGGGVRAVSSGFDANAVLAIASNNTARYDADTSVTVSRLALMGESSLDWFVSKPGTLEGVLPVTMRVSGHYGLPCQGIAVTAA